MKFLQAILFCCLCSTAFAQKLGPYTISSAGQAFENEEVMVYTSVGEPLNTMISDGELTISQGILQVVFTEAALANLPCATDTKGTLFFDNCDDGTLFFFIRTEDGTIYDPYYAAGVSFEHEEGEAPVQFGFIEADFATPCSIAEKAILITCIDALDVSTNDGLVPSFEPLFKILPNPSAQQIQVVIQDQNIQQFNLRISDTQGKAILQQSNVQHEDLVDISAMPNGIYYLTLTNEEQQQKTLKLIKQ